MRDILAHILALGLVTGMIDFGIHFFAFGQTFEGEIALSSENVQTPDVGRVTFQSRFMNRRFPTHSILEILVEWIKLWQTSRLSLRIDRY